MGDPVASYEDQFVRATPSVLVPDMRLMVLSMVRDAGFSVLVADRVIMAESGWNPNSIGDHGRSFGLWQINLYNPSGNVVHGISEECATDAFCSTKFAIELLKSARSWNHWTTYRNIYASPN